MNQRRRTFSLTVVLMSCLVVSCWMTYWVTLSYRLNFGPGSAALFLFSPIVAGIYAGESSRSYRFMLCAILITSVVVAIIFAAMYAFEYSSAQTTGVLFRMLGMLLGLQTVGAVLAVSLHRLLEKRAGGVAMEGPSRAGMVFYGLVIAFFSLVIWAISRYRRP